MAAARWSPVTMFSCALGLAWMWYSGQGVAEHAVTSGVLITVVAFMLGEGYTVFYCPGDCVNDYYITYIVRLSIGFFDICFWPKASGWRAYWYVGYWSSTFHVQGGFLAKDKSIVATVRAGLCNFKFLECYIDYCCCYFPRLFLYLYVDDWRHNLPSSFFVSHFLIPCQWLMVVSVPVNGSFS